MSKDWSTKTVIFKIQLLSKHSINLRILLRSMVSEINANLIDIIHTMLKQLIRVPKENAGRPIVIKLYVRLSVPQNVSVNTFVVTR